MNKNNFLNSKVETFIDTTDQESTLEKICETKGGERSQWKEYERTMHEIIITKCYPLGISNNFNYNFWHKEVKDWHEDNIRLVKIIQDEYIKELLWYQREKRIKNSENSINKRSVLKHIPLNEKFEGSEGHHVDKEHIIYIPKKLHRSVYHNIWNGYGMKEINDLAIKYTYGEHEESRW